MAPALPSAQPITLSVNATLQPPLSRRGHGPGLILLTESSSDSFKNETLDPLPLQKWAEVCNYFLFLSFALFVGLDLFL